MIAAVTAKKLKIKFSSQRIETAPAIKGCESAHNANKNYGSRACDTQSAMLKPVVPGANKRGPSCMVESRPQKKPKMDCNVAHQCCSLIKSLINHPSGWAFREPVDPVALNIPDYFSIISNPMDLGTIKSKLEKNQYSGIEEFAADVRLIFSNAMLYNPPTNYVHQMAESMNKIFETKWKSLEQKWNREISKSGDRKILSGKPLTHNCPEMPPLRNALSPKRSKPSQDKATRSSLSSQTANVKISKPASKHKTIEQNSYKGTSSGRRHACCSISVKPSSSPVVNECGANGRSSRQCCFSSDSTHASSDISSERSSGRDDNACDTEPSKLDFQRKSILNSQMSKSDPDSDGAVSAVDDENACPSSQLMTPPTDAASEGWRPPSFDVQLSPTKALRAAMLKHRFADTILKAQHKALLDQGDKADPVKLQQEKERLERRQREEKAWIEAQIRAAEAASRMREEIELKEKREKEREAARIALQKMEKTAEIEQNLEIVKELEMLSGGSLSYHFRIGSKQMTKREMEGAYSRSPLERLGLFIKDDFWDEDETLLNGDEEEGEIFT